MAEEIEDFHIYASNVLKTMQSRILKDEEMFGVFDVTGDVERYGRDVDGLYLEDMRHLNQLTMQIHGARPILLSSTVKRNNIRMTADLTNAEYCIGETRISDDSLHLFRSKFLYENGCYESLQIQNFTHDQTIPVPLSIGFRADFRDIFEIRGHERERRGDIREASVGDDHVVFRYDGLDEKLRKTRITFSKPPDDLSETTARFDIELAPGETRELSFTVDCFAHPEESDELTEPEPKFFPTTFSSLAQKRSDSESRRCRISSSNEIFNSWVERSQADLLMLTVDTEHGPYPHAGTPWFNTVFGRDGILTAYELLTVHPDTARGVLCYLAKTQAETHDAKSDAEPGKILHETRLGEASAVGEVPFARYYGSVDATPLFVWLAGAYLKRTNDLDFIESIWPSIRAAIAWIEDFGDEDDDGFVEYSRKSERGLVHQGWKDSHDSVFHRDGRPAEGPIALCEVQAYVYGARRAAAKIARAIGDSSFAERQYSKAGTLKQQFEREFWSDELDSYVLALDGDNEPCRVRTSNPGHCLLFGIASAERAHRLADTLTQAAMFSEWGIRTLASNERRFNPMSYHNGSIWPHDNAIIARGLARYGLQSKCLRLFESLFRASNFFELHRLPELFCGFQLRPGEGPTSYPVACSPQAWAAGAVFLLLDSLLNLTVDARQMVVEFREPRLPADLGSLEFENLCVGPGSVDIILRRYRDDVGVEVVDREGPIEVRVVK